MKKTLAFILIAGSLAANNNALENNSALQAIDNPNDAYTSNEDHLIVINIRARISSQFGTKYDGIAIHVSNGAVTFTGTVDSSVDIPVFTAKATSVSGVTSVANHLTVVNKGQATDSGNSLNTYMTEKDRVIALNVRAAIKAVFGTNYDSLAVSVQNGVVRLSGVVNSQSDMNQLVSNIRLLEGVESVDNHLTLKPAPEPHYEDGGSVDPRDSFVTAADRQIVIALRAALESTSADKYDKVYISANNGIVTLTGEVPVKSDAELAVYKAIQTGGVKSVNDTIRYTPSEEEVPVKKP